MVVESALIHTILISSDIMNVLKRPRPRSSSPESEVCCISNDCPVPGLFKKLPCEQVRSAIENLFKCNLCHSKFKSRGKHPLLLHCGHSLCSSCVKRISISHDALKSVTCPYCRQPTIVSKISGICKNFFLEEVIESAGKADLGICTDRVDGTVLHRSCQSQRLFGTNKNGVHWEFFGQLNAKGIRHGCGKCTWSDGTTFSGEWKDGNMDGTGVLHFSSTDTYIGSMRLNASHGVGMLLQADGSVSSGFWKDGKFLG